jgi:hypothetical protein
MKKRKNNIKEKEKSKNEFDGIEVDIEKSRLKVNFNGYHFLVYQQRNEIVLMKVNANQMSDTLHIRPAAGNVIIIK